jgi:hypothetical protein
MVKKIEGKTLGSGKNCNIMMDIYRDKHYGKTADCRA